MNRLSTRKILAGAAVATALTLGATAGPAAAARPTQQAGAVGGLVAAVVQTGDIRIVTVETGDINVELQNILNNNRVLTDFLNNNDVNIEDVIDITVVDNVVQVVVLGVAAA